MLHRPRRAAGQSAAGRVRRNGAPEWRAGQSARVERGQGFRGIHTLHAQGAKERRAGHGIGFAQAREGRPSVARPRPRSNAPPPARQGRRAPRAPRREGCATGQGPLRAGSGAGFRRQRGSRRARRQGRRTLAQRAEHNEVGRRVAAGEVDDAALGLGVGEGLVAISTPPRRRSVSAATSSVSRSSAVAVGLLGLQSSTLGVAAASARASEGRRRSLCPARAQACGCSS